MLAQVEKNKSYTTHSYIKGPTDEVLDLKKLHMCFSVKISSNVVNLVIKHLRLLCRLI